VIDLDELRAAERDPVVKKWLEEADAYGKRVARQGKLIYLGPVYVRPIGRGITLYTSHIDWEELPYDVADAAKQLQEVEIIDWIEWWLKKTGRLTTDDGDSPLLRITIEDLDRG
jgi:hypothetical protein